MISGSSCTRDRRVSRSARTPPRDGSLSLLVAILERARSRAIAAPACERIARTDPIPPRRRPPPRRARTRSWRYGSFRSIAPLHRRAIAHARRASAARSMSFAASDAHRAPIGDRALSFSDAINSCFPSARRNRPPHESITRSSCRRLILFCGSRDVAENAGSLRGHEASSAAFCAGAILPESCPRISPSRTTTPAMHSLCLRSSSKHVALGHGEIAPRSFVTLAQVMPSD